jgi:hypothetical protein
MRIIYDEKGNVTDIKDYPNDRIFNNKARDVDLLNRIYT